MEEVLTSTIDSKASRSTAESAVTTFSELGHCEVTSQVDPDTAGSGQPHLSSSHAVPSETVVSNAQNPNEAVTMWRAEKGDDELLVQGSGIGRASCSVDDRTPRYGRQFTTYADMLDQLNDQDPFHSEKPPASHKKPISRPSLLERAHSTGKPAKATTKLKSEKHTVKDTASAKKIEHKRPRHLHKSKSENAQDSFLTGGFTNQGYDLSRRDSSDSNKTYVVGRKDSSEDGLDNEQSTSIYQDLPAILHASMQNLGVVTGNLLSFFSNTPPEDAQDWYHLDKVSHD